MNEKQEGRLVGFGNGGQLSGEGRRPGELACRAGLSAAVVQALERGIRSDPRLSTVVKLAAAPGLPVGDLAGGAANSDNRRSIPIVR